MTLTKDDIIGRGRKCKCGSTKKVFRTGYHKKTGRPTLKIYCLNCKFTSKAFN